MNTEHFVIEQTYAAPVERVWKALTELQQIRDWYFDIKEFKPEVGFEFTFEGGTEDKTYLHICCVTDVIPLQKLAYSWRYEGYPGNTIVTFELFDEGAATRLKLTHAGLETFDAASDPNFAKESFAQGWAEITGKMLKKYVEKA